ncbi:hypothetical protein D9615_007516 [Tricholomella constricta]|uniref:PIN domain-containing protein n=1 Tax=Tricholomella constricta TaxID=117010 RepID=A0A8H5H6X6_9AGAR|nr:hypothetical protein D9615_007516 [Tricholomella constricta]
MSRALGAAFLNHQVEQLEKSVSAPNGPASGNWRRRQAAPAATQVSLPFPNGNTKRPPMAPGIKVASRRPGEESQAARKGRAPGREQGGGVPRTHPQEAGGGGRRRSSDEEREDRKAPKDADVVVVDASVLVHALYQLKKWCRDGREEVIIVPLEALNTLDLLKKGTSPLAQRARAASRVLEAQVGTNPRIRVQQDDAFVLWDQIEFKDALDPSEPTRTPPVLVPSASASAPAPAHTTSPEWVRRTICCAQWEVEHTTEAAARGSKNPPPPTSTPSKTKLKPKPKVVLAVLAPTPDLSGTFGDLKLSSSSFSSPTSTPAAAPVPLPAPHVHANKHEPRTSGTLVAHWAGRARIAMLPVDPTSAPPPAPLPSLSPSGDDEASGRGGAKRKASDGGGGGKGLHHGHGHGGHGHGGGGGGHGGGGGGGALVERPAAVMAMMEMVAQPTKVVRVLARGEKLDPDP